MRQDKRKKDQLREISFTRHFTRYAEGSVLTSFGHTKVLCTASVIPGVPKFLKESKQGWITAEYGMLPRSTNTRLMRESVSGKQGGRTKEIQRLIGRSLRSVTNLKQLGDYTIIIDCDVLQADGGTRTAAISGSCIALVDALTYMKNKKLIKINPLKEMIAAISVGFYQKKALLDLDYLEDSNADLDMNIVMTESGQFIEIQGTAEKEPFKENQLDTLLKLAKKGIQDIIKAEKVSLSI